MNNRKQAFFPTINNVFDSFFKDDFFTTNANIPAFNVKESNDGFVLELAVPGLTKEDFNIELKNGLLSVHTERKVEENTSDEKYIRKGFNYQSFKRAFRLPKSIDANAVSASYENGVLSLALPKKEEAKVLPARAIEIA